MSLSHFTNNKYTPWSNVNINSLRIKNRGIILEEAEEGDTLIFNKESNAFKPSQLEKSSNSVSILEDLLTELETSLKSNQSEIDKFLDNKIAINAQSLQSVQDSIDSNKTKLEAIRVKIVELSKVKEIVVSGGYKTTNIQGVNINYSTPHNNDVLCYDMITESFEFRPIHKWRINDLYNIYWDESGGELSYGYIGNTSNYAFINFEDVIRKALRLNYQDIHINVGKMKEMTEKRGEVQFDLDFRAIENNCSQVIVDGSLNDDFYDNVKIQSNTPIKFKNINFKHVNIQTDSYAEFDGCTFSTGVLSKYCSFSNCIFNGIMVSSPFSEIILKDCEINEQIVLQNCSKLLTNQLEIDGIKIKLDSNSLSCVLA